eukprot:scaffold297291_cov32-Tisochrysis_lutea.AAC.6
MYWPASSSSFLPLGTSSLGSVAAPSLAGSCGAGDGGGSAMVPPGNMKGASIPTTFITAVYVKRWSASDWPSTSREVGGRRCIERMSEVKTVVSSISSSVRMGFSAETDTRIEGPFSALSGSHSSSMREARSIGSSESEASPSGTFASSSSSMRTGVFTSWVRLTSSFCTVYSALKPNAGAASSGTTSDSSGSSRPGKAACGEDAHLHVAVGTGDGRQGRGKGGREWDARARAR